MSSKTNQVILIATFLTQLEGLPSALTIPGLLDTVNARVCISIGKASEQETYKYRKRIKQVRSDGVANELENKSSYSYGNFSDTSKGYFQPLRYLDSWIQWTLECRKRTRNAKQVHTHKKHISTGKASEQRTYKYRKRISTGNTQSKFICTRNA